MESYSETIKVLLEGGMHRRPSHRLVNYMGHWRSENVNIIIQNPDTGKNYTTLDVGKIGNDFKKGTSVKITVQGDLEKKELEKIVGSIKRIFTINVDGQTLQENLEESVYSGFPII